MVGLFLWDHRPEDIGWMLALSAPRVEARAKLLTVEGMRWVAADQVAYRDAFGVRWERWKVMEGSRQVSVVWKNWTIGRYQLFEVGAR
jgi:hypothetical protein